MSTNEKDRKKFMCVSEIVTELANEATNYLDRDDISDLQNFVENFDDLLLALISVDFSLDMETIIENCVLTIVPFRGERGLLFPYSYNPEDLILKYKKKYIPKTQNERER